MPAIRPTREPLVGRFIRLEPYREDHLPGLWVALGRPEVFAGGYGGGPEGLPVDEVAFREWAPNYFPHTRGNTYVVVAQGGGARRRGCRRVHPRRFRRGEGARAHRVDRL